MGAVHAHDLLARRYLEMLPARDLALGLVRRQPMPVLVDQVLAKVIQDAQAMNHATLFVLVDVYV